MSLTPIRAARNLSAAVVAGIAAWSSYHHMVEVALGVGERPDVAYVLPLSVDGMLVVASVAMVDDRRSGRRVRWSARLAFAVGVLASVGANVAAAAPTVGARVVAAWPAVALLLTVELLSRAGRLREADSARTQVEAVEPAPELTVDELLERAVDAVADYRTAAEKPIGRDALRATMGVGAEKAGVLLPRARGERVNGHAVELDPVPTG